MKKILTIVFSILLTLSLTSIVSAEEPTMDSSGSGTWSGSASGSSFETKSTINKESAIDEGTTDYYVTIAWSTTNGSYKVKGDTYKWDGENMKYIRVTDGQDNTIDDTTKAPATSTITITNQSNGAVNYTISYASNKQGETAISSETSSSGTKTGSLASYVESNDIDLSKDASGNEEIDYSGTDYAIPTATYKGTITLDNYTSNDYDSNPVELGTYTVEIKKAIKSISLKLTANNSSSGNMKFYQYDGENAPTLVQKYSGIDDSKVVTNLNFDISKKYLVVCCTGTFENELNPYWNLKANATEVELDLSAYDLPEETKVFEITDDATIECKINFND